MATRILVVDDSPTIRAVVTTILERNGYEPRVASDGQNAYEALASGEITADLLLVDFVMPRMNGFQLCVAIRKTEELQHLPVVLMSAKADRIREQFVSQTGAVDAITKPFDAEALVAVIENALRKVNTVRGSARMAAAAPVAPDEPNDTEQFIADKLATIVLSTIARRREVASFSALKQAIADRLSKEAIVSIFESAYDPARGKPRVASLLTGDLAVVPIGAVLQLLQTENQTGVLVCTNGLTEVRATFRNGAIDLVQSTGARDEFRLGRFFVEEGILTPSAIEQFLGVAKEPSSTELEAPPDSEAPDRPSSPPLGMALLAAGKIDDAQLKGALLKQSSELLYDVLRWPSGRFELRRQPASELAAQAKLGLPVASVVMEGFRRVDEWRLLERTLGSFDAVLFRDDDAFGALDLTSLPPKEKAVLDAVDGDRTIRAIIAASHLSSFDACRILVQFLEARALRRRAR